MVMSHDQISRVSPAVDHQLRLVVNHYSPSPIQITPQVVNYDLLLVGQISQRFIQIDVKLFKVFPNLLLVIRHIVGVKILFNRSSIWED